MKNKISEWFSALDKKDFETLSKLLNDGFDINSRDYLGNHSLFYMLGPIEPDVVKFLIDNGVSIEHTTFKDTLSTPLHHAIDGGCSELAVYLIECGANVYYKNLDFADAFEFALRNDDVEVVKAIFKKYPDYLQKQPYNYSIIEYICEFKLKNCILFFEENEQFLTENEKTLIKKSRIAALF